MSAYHYFISYSKYRPLPLTMQGSPVNTRNRQNASVFAIRIQCRLTIIFDDEKRGKKPLWINIEEQDQTEGTSFNHIIAIHNPQIIGTISNLCR